MDSIYRAVVTSDEDIKFENDVNRSPYSVKTWLHYLHHKHDAPALVRNIIWERAVHALPGSYKLWFQYLMERVAQIRMVCITDPAWESVNACFERALQSLGRMPRLWVEYIKLLIVQRRITNTRRVFDRALRTLPVTQHTRVWDLYIKFVKQPFIPPETLINTYRRYMRFNPSGAEEFVEVLVRAGGFQEAANLLVTVLNDEMYQSKGGKGTRALWDLLCRLCVEHPNNIVGIDVEAMLKHGIRQFVDETASFWCSLAQYFVARGHFEKAKDVFEEGMDTVTTVHDFSIIFDAYTATEEGILTAKMEGLDEEKGSEEEDGNDDLEFSNSDDVDMRLARLEHLMDRRPLLVNSVLLRQNPHDVNEWKNRVEILKDSPEHVVSTYTKAVRAVDPLKAVGKYEDLWISFAKYYDDEHNDVEAAEKIFEQAVLENYRRPGDLASVWCEYAEMEIRHNRLEKALSVVKRATHVPPKHIRNRKLAEGATVQDRVHRSLRLWNLYADLEENIGTLATLRSVYDQILKLRIATPQTILQYASVLEERNYFEDSFKVFERGIHMFHWPQVNELWIAYLDRFIARYEGKYVERTRDLFEQAVKDAPPDQAKLLFLMYAKYEEEYGLSRRAMRVLDRATQSVKKEDMFDVYVVYLNRAMTLFGAARTREIYQKAVETLPPNRARTMCLRFANMETQLGEIDRARAIFAYGAQFSNPTSDREYWDAWHTFEIQHGNEDTFRNMLRVRRTIHLRFNSDVHVATSMYLEARSGWTARDRQGEKGGVQRESGGRDVRNAPPEKVERSLPVAPPPPPIPRETNPDAIEIEEDEEDEEDEERETRIDQGKKAGRGEESEDDGEEQSQHDIELTEKKLPASLFRGVGAGDS
eukprot:TRINITY_DN2401_c0_g1_i1.p1 TRINITY_DN2401_c0_g1~~TRINITY_DN2401_c0_g1_i1.p1  ORF type:complete len:897 (+),score=245.17 TRINITY_DN2401_c0_g1_i1:73-2691(+)